MAPRSTEIKRGERLPIADVQCGANKRGRRPGQVLQDVRLRQHLQALWRDGRETEHAVLVEHNDLAIGVEKLGAREAAVLPGDLTGLQVDRRDKGRAEVAARTVGVLAETDDGADVDAH